MDTTKPAIINDELKVGGSTSSYVCRGQRWVTKYGCTEYARVIHLFLTLDDTIQRKLSSFVNREISRDVSLIMCYYEIHNVTARKNLSISSTAYVTPGIPNDQDGALDEDILKNKSYIVVPPM
eukprot:15353236-Ditylum_brightwellii.AAC.1